ncbi:hypothetical protein [Kocuria rosea]|uniref:hypothetical protein n=1 Tax=Kocuria rosea TaxID=1275 RepID=UPI00232F9352|nr:hypothetical protein [Kocuria rosea]
MGRLRIGGQVSYLDGSPAEAAKVFIIEKDSGPGGRDDNILEVVCDANGRFSGLSREWNDREGVVWGVNLPDILNLAFRVELDGRKHAGPFVRLGNSSAPIVLPWGQPKPVRKEDRDLVQVIYLSDGFTGAERALYEFIEKSAKTVASSILGPLYRRLTCLEKNEATLPNFVQAVKVATDSRVEAVDVIFNLHGNTDRLEFADRKYQMSAVRDAFLALPPKNRKKLRCVFSTACYGKSHLDEWIDAGFNEAMGSRGISADAQTSYVPLLGAWALENAFAASVNASNDADPLRLGDQLARAFYTAQGKDAQASEIDSFRERLGNGRSKIYTTP